MFGNQKYQCGTFKFYFWSITTKTNIAGLKYQKKKVQMKRVDMPLYMSTFLVGACRPRGGWQVHHRGVGVANNGKITHLELPGAGLSRANPQPTSGTTVEDIWLKEERTAKEGAGRHRPALLMPLSWSLGVSLSVWGVSAFLSWQLLRETSSGPLHSVFLFTTTQMVITSGGHYAPPASKSIVALVTWLPGRGDPRQGSFPAGSREGGFPWPILQGHSKGASVEAHSGEPFPGWAACGEWGQAGSAPQWPWMSAPGSVTTSFHVFFATMSGSSAVKTGKACGLEL